MSIFDGIISVDSNGNVLSNEWKEWIHALIPNSPKVLRDIIRLILMAFAHCLICSSLSGCYFVVRNMPKQPLHINRDCGSKSISYGLVRSKASAECNIDKFLNYIFTDDVKSKGKKKIFENLGYTADDAYILSKEYEKQALENYLSGNYILKSLDLYGQRLAIVIQLNNRSFYTGWMLEPEGKIRNTTPFGGWC